jgi:hypothetical protein
VRIAAVQPDEVAYLVRLGQELVAAGTFGTDGPAFDWNYTLMSTKRVLDLPDYYIRMAWDDDNMPCGFVAGHLTPFFFSPRLMAVEDGWFVRAGTKDRAKIAMRLMKGMMAWAIDECKAVLLQTGDIASIDTVAVWALYNRLGFTRFGAVYKYARGQ